MGLNAALEIGRNGLSVYQTATEVTAENIANVNTPGYSRQRVVLESAPPTTANGFPLGAGVRIATVERSYDSLLQQQLVIAQTAQSYDTTKYNVLQQIEPTFNEIATDGLGAAISNFFGAWQDLTVNPSGFSERQAVLSRAQILVDNFHSVSKTLNDTITTENASLVPQTNDINAILTSIAQLNGQIQTTELVSGNANEIRDQRDQLVRDLSEKMGIKFTENTDGTTDVYVSGVTDPGPPPVTGNIYLVQGSKAGSLTLSGTTYTVTAHDANGTASSTVDANMYTASDGGELWATLQMRDTIIPGYLSQVDSLAAAIASTVNAVHTAGSDLNGNDGIAFFDAASATAASIAINPALTSTDQIAAAGKGAPAGDNSNALQIAQLQNALTMSTNTASFNSYYDRLVSSVGLDVQTAKNTVTQDDVFTKQLTSLRESNSGVSLDEELTNLVKYQRSYQASAKLITTVADMLDMVMGIIH